MAIHIPWRLGELLPVTWSIRSSIRKLGVVDLPANPDSTQRNQFETSIRAQHPSLREGQVHAVMGWQWPDVPPIKVTNTLVPRWEPSSLFIGYDSTTNVGDMKPTFIPPDKTMIITKLIGNDNPEALGVYLVLEKPREDIEGIVITDTFNNTVKLWYTPDTQQYQSRPEDASAAWGLIHTWNIGEGQEQPLNLEVVLAKGAT